MVCNGKLLNSPEVFIKLAWNSFSRLFKFSSDRPTFYCNSTLIALIVHPKPRVWLIWLGLVSLQPKSPCGLGWPLHRLVCIQVLLWPISIKVVYFRIMNGLLGIFLFDIVIFGWDCDSILNQGLPRSIPIMGEQRD